MKLPIRLFFSVCLVSMFSMVLIFADNSISSASMNIEAYKEIKPPEGIFNIQVSFLNESGSKTPVSGIGDAFDMSFRDMTSLTKVFVVMVQSNYGDKVKFSFRFSPFVNQINRSKTLSASYMISADKQDPVTVSSSSYYYYDYRFMASFSPDITQSTNFELVTASSSEVSCSVDYLIKGERKLWYDGSYSEFSLSSGTISQLGTQSYVETNIYGSLIVDKTGIEPNVDYVSTVVISLEVL